MIQLLNIIIVAFSVWAVEIIGSIRMRRKEAAIAVGLIAIIEIFIASVVPKIIYPSVAGYVLILVMNPALEEAVRVKFSVRDDAYSINAFLGVSAMIGSLEAITKCFTLTNLAQVSEFFTDVNLYIMISSIISIFIHLNFGILLHRMASVERFMSFLAMMLLHATYNFIVVSFEPQNLIGKNIYLSIILLVNAIFCVMYIRGKNRFASSFS